MAHNLDPATWTTYENAAAGHDGVLTDSTGDVVIKPCTQAEIDFYEISRAYHPDFAAHMPTYMGSVRLKNPEESIKTGPAIARSPKLSRAPTIPSHSRSASTQDAAPPLPPLPSQPAAPPEHQQQQPTPGHDSGNGNGNDNSDSSTKGSSARTALKGKALETDTAIVLENIAAGFVRPNILDIKLGARLWADDAPAEKRARLDRIAATTTSSSLGFRIAGMRVWRGRPAGAVMPSERPRAGDTIPAIGGGGGAGADGSGRGSGSRGGNGGGDLVGGEVAANVDMSGSPTALQIETEGMTDPVAGYQIYDKSYGQNFNRVTVKNAFDEFFLPVDYACDVRARRHVVEKCVRELGELQAKLEVMECRMYSASILCVYEGDNAALDAAIREERFPGSVMEAAARTGDPAQTMVAARLQMGGGGVAHDGNRSTSTAAPSSSASAAATAVAAPSTSAGHLARADGNFDDDYDADDAEEEDDESEPELPKVSALKLIDFAHAKWTPGEGPDENLLQGVRSVRTLLEELLASTNTNGTTSDL